MLGVTGNPGSGKSTLCDRLIAAYRQRGHRVGVVAVDPSSPYSGGAILGDRIRMSRHAGDEGVFIRSLATRGHLGGLTRSARDVVRVLDAAAYDVIIVETVGVGQDELEITHTAHSTLVVMAPGLGDDVQAIKAGILECADVFVVNKADRDGADATVRDLELMVSLGNESARDASRSRGHVTHGAVVGPAGGAAPSPGQAPPGERWTPPITKCVAVARATGWPTWSPRSIDIAPGSRGPSPEGRGGAGASRSRCASPCASRSSRRRWTDLGPALDEATRAVGRPTSSTPTRRSSS